MKKLVLFCFAACLCALASAQKVYFLYLQSDDQTPFYVKMGDKIHSSAASGYLIIPNLNDGNYTFGLGFARSSAAEAKFSVTINQNDKGYLIKNFDDGIALFDVQDLSLVKANASPQDNTAYETKTDKFSTILSKAANDPNLLKVPVAKKEQPAIQKPAETAVVKETVIAKVEEPKSSEQTPVENSVTQTTIETAAVISKPESGSPDTATIEATAKESKAPETLPVQQEEKKEVAEVLTAVYKPSIINRYSESSTTEGFGVIYFDKNEIGTDTIRILIPAPKVKLVADTETASVTEIQAKPDETSSVAAEAKKSEVDETAKANTSLTAVTSTSNCKSIASDKDFLKLRRKMASKDNNDAMLDEARKDFRGKCYSVEQIRNLSALFLTSASKYQFFDVAYYSVSDKNNFVSLGTEIKDEHYTKRFKALIGE